MCYIKEKVKNVDIGYKNENKMTIKVRKVIYNRCRKMKI